MSHATLHDDGLDTCYQMVQTTVTPQRRWPATSTLLRGALYGVLTLGALAVGLLAMSPEGLPLDKLIGEAMMPKRAGSCCSQLQLEIPSGAPAPAYDPQRDRPGSDEVVSVRTEEATDL